MTQMNEDEQPKKPKTRLRRLTINEGSLVDKGDNPGASVVMFKNEGETPTATEEDTIREGWLIKVKRLFKMGEMRREPKTTGEILSEDRFKEEFFKLRMAFRQSIDSIMDLAPSDETGDLLRRSVEEFSIGANVLASTVGKQDPTVAKQLVDLLHGLSETVSVESLSDVAKTQEGFATIMTRIENFELPQAVAMENNVTVKSFDEVMAGLGEEEQATIKAAMTVSASQTKETETQEDDVVKSLPEAIQKRLADAEQIAKDAMQKAEKLESEKRDSEFLEKAKELNIVGVPFADVAAALKMADDAGERGESVTKLLGTFSELATKSSSLLKEIGTETHEEGSAEAEMNKLVGEVRKARPELTKEQAYTNVLENHSDMYGKLMNEGV